MSTKYVKAVLDYLPALTSPIDTLVLLAIAEHASDETRLAWPSVASIMRRTRLDRRTVQRALRELEKLGAMSTTLGGQDQNNGLNSASRYRLEFDHAGRPIVDVVKQPAKRAPATPAPRRSSSTRPGLRQPPKQPSVPMPSALRMKKIPTGEQSPDLASEKQRQLAALKKLSS